MSEQQHPKERVTVPDTYGIFSFQGVQSKDTAGAGRGVGTEVGSGAGSGASKLYRPPPDSERTAKATNDRKPKLRKIGADKGKGEFRRSAAVPYMCDMM